MPADIKYLPKSSLISFEEIQRLVSILATLGITKVRLTGGEPFMRKDLPNLIEKIMQTEGIAECHITTNGVLTSPYVSILRNIGVTSVNLSLDAFEKTRFQKITGRDDFEKCLHTLQLLLEHDIPVKINCVVMSGLNTEDILPLIELTKYTSIAVRFIEAMPFNGADFVKAQQWDHKKILNYITNSFPLIAPLQREPNSTASMYKIPGYTRSIGVIAGFSRTFCGACNRIRITANGTLKTCLYDNGVLNIRELLRSGEDDSVIAEKLIESFQHRPKDGHEAEEKRPANVDHYESMSLIGG